MNLHHPTKGDSPAHESYPLSSVIKFPPYWKGVCVAQVFTGVPSHPLPRSSKKAPTSKTVWRLFKRFHNKIFWITGREEEPSRDWEDQRQTPIMWDAMCKCYWSACTSSFSRCLVHALFCCLPEAPNILTIVMLVFTLATAAHLHDSYIVECVCSSQILRVQLERMHVTAINTNIHLQTWRTQCTIIFTSAAPPRQIFGSPADLPSNMVRKALGQQGQKRWRHLDGVRRLFVGRFFCSYSSVL